MPIPPSIRRLALSGSLVLFVLVCALIARFLASPSEPSPAEEPVHSDDESETLLAETTVPPTTVGALAVPPPVAVPERHFAAGSTPPPRGAVRFPPRRTTVISPSLSSVARATSLTSSTPKLRSFALRSSTVTNSRRMFRCR